MGVARSEEVDGFSPCREALLPSLALCSDDIVATLTVDIVCQGRKLRGIGERVDTKVGVMLKDNNVTETHMGKKWGLMVTCV